MNCGLYIFIKNFEMNRHKSCNGKDPRNVNKTVGRAHSTLSVSAVDYYLHLPVTCPPSPAISTVTLTPGRIRNIDQDMENIRASRQDNPFIQQVIASRESLIDSLDTEEESDHVNLMAKELALDIDVDPFSLPEMHEHMIRSPPPTNWPKSPNFRVFQFPHGEEETISVEVNVQGQLNIADWEYSYFIVFKGDTYDEKIYKGNIFWVHKMLPKLKMTFFIELLASEIVRRIPKSLKCLDS